MLLERGQGGDARASARGMPGAGIAIAGARAGGKRARAPGPARGRAGGRCGTRPAEGSGPGRAGEGGTGAAAAPPGAAAGGRNRGGRGPPARARAARGTAPPAIPRPSAPRRPPPPAAILLASAALLACCLAGAPPAHADGNPLTVEITSSATSPTALRAVPFTMEFGGAVNASTLDASDVNASSGAVSLRATLQPGGTFGGRGSDNGQFHYPSGVAADASSGIIYVADSINARVQAFDSATLLHVADLPGPFGYPAGVAVDGSGRVYVADSALRLVRVFDSGRNHVDDIRGPFVSPYGVAVDGSGRAHVADPATGTVLVFDSGGRHEANVTGFANPYGVAVDGSGRMYVADALNNRTRIFDSGRNHVADIHTPLAHPHGVAVDGSGRVYVADPGGDRVRVFDSTLESIADLPGPFRRPNGVAVDVSGSVYVADTGNHRVRAFDAAHAFDVHNPADGQNLTVGVPAGRVQGAAGNANEASNTVSISINRTAPVPVITAAQPGPTNATTINFVVDFGGPVTEFGLGDVAISGTASHNGVENFAGSGAAYAFVVTPTSDGTILVDIPAGAALYAAGHRSDAAARFSIARDVVPPVPVIDAALPGPTGLPAVPFTVKFGEAVNAATLDASDFDASSGTVRDLRIAPQQGGAFGGRGSGNGEFHYPSGVAADASSGMVYVADSMNSRVQAFDSSGVHVADIPGPFSYPMGVAVDGSSGTVYVADSTRGLVRVFDSGRSHVADMRGPFGSPSGVAVDASSGAVYVADTATDTVLVFDSALSHVANITGFANPYGVAVDGRSGEIYVADTSNGRIRIFDSALSHVADMRGPFGSPYGVAVDGSSGAVYVADASNDRVRIFDSAGSHVADLPGQFQRPNGVAVDGNSGAVYVADTAGHSVSVFDAAYAFDVHNPADRRTLTVSVPAGRVEDAAGNANEASNAEAIGIDRMVQFPVVAAAQSSPTNATTINFVVNFTHSVTGFAAANVTLSGNATHGGVANFSGSGAVYTFDVLPTSDGEIRVDIPAGAARNGTGGSPTAAADRFTIVSDRTPPHPAVTAEQSSPTGAATIAFTVNFTEPVRGFAAANVTLSGNATHGGVANFAAANATTYTFDVSPASDGDIRVDIPAGAARDDAGNPSIAAKQFNITYDSTPLIPRIAAAQPGPTSLRIIPFTLHFNASVNSSTLAASDIDADSGTVRDLRPAFPHAASFGGPGSGNGEFGGPTGIATDPTTGEIYVADIRNGRVQVFDSSMRHARNIAGPLVNPTGVAVDPSSGEVYVSDQGNHNVAVFDSAGRNIANITANATLPFFFPQGVAVDSGRTYVADWANKRVAIFDSARQHVADISGTLETTRDVAVDPSSGLIYVADEGSDHVAVFDSARRSIANITGPFSRPSGIALDPSSGYAYVADSDNDRVAVLDIAGRDIADTTGPPGDRAGGPLVPVVSGRSIADITASFGEPTDVAVDPSSGRVYVADMETGRVHAFDAAYAFGVADAPDGRTLTVSLPAGRVQGADGGKNVESNAAAVYVDRTAPVPAVNSTQSGRTNATTIDFVVNFSKPVRGFASGDVVLSGTAAHGGIANFAAASATAWTFDVSPESDGTIRVDIPEGAARDASGNPSEAAARFTIVSDRTPPVPAVTAEPPSPTNATTIAFTVNFSEPVRGFEHGDVTLSNSTAHGGVAGFSAANSTAWTFAVSPTSDGTILVRIADKAARDEAGNPSRAARFSIEYDAMPPVPALDAARPGPTNLTAVPFAAKFGEAMDASTLDASDFDVSSGEARNLRAMLQLNGTFGSSAAGNRTFNLPQGVAVDGISGRIYVADTSNETVQVFDSAWNHVRNLPGAPSLHYGVAVDAATGDVYVVGQSGSIRIFDPDGNPVNTISGGFLDPFDTPSGVAVDGSTGYIYVADTYNDRISILDSARDRVGDFRDSFSRPSGVAVDSSSGWMFVADTDNDRVRAYDPGRSSGHDLPGPFSRPSGVAVDSSSGRIYVADTDNHRVRVFDPSLDPVANFTGPFKQPYGVAVDGTSGRVYVADTHNHSIQAFDTAYAFDVHNPADGRNLTVSMKAGSARDAAGNANEASNAAEISIDRTAPVPAVTAAQPNATNATTINFMVNFSEPVYGFDRNDVDLSGTAARGGIANFAAANATTWTFDVSPASDGTIRVDIPANASRDRAGNGNEAAARFTIAYDTMFPIAEISSAQAGPTNATTISFTVNFSEPVYGFDRNDVVLSGTAARGGIADFSGGNSTYNFDVSPESDGTIQVYVPAGAARDLAGHPNPASARLSVTSDGTPPTATVATAQPGPSSLRAVPFTAKFSEAVNALTLDASDFDVSSGEARNLRTMLQLNGTFGGSGAGDGEFRNPTGVAVNGSGYVYVADADNRRIQVFDPALRHHDTIAGPPSEPSAVAVDGFTGTVYAAYADDRTIRVFNSDGIANGTINGPPGGPFVRPAGVAVDGSTGTIYVADAGNGTVRVFDSDRRHAGELPGPFVRPAGVAVDGSTGTIYVADAGSGTVRVFDSDRRHAGELPGPFVRPAGVAVDGSTGTIYVADAGSGAVLAFNSTLQRVATAAAALGNQSGVAVGGSGSVYAADPGGDRIQAFDTAYAFDVADPDDGRTLTVSLPAGRAEDAAGNGNEASNAASIRTDRTDPIPAVGAVQSSPTSAAAINFIVNFSEPVLEFDQNDVVLSGTAARGGIANFSGGNSTYHFDVSPESEGTMLVNIPAGAALDDAGNPSRAAARFSIEYDATPPVPTVAPAQPGPSGLRAVPFTVKFSDVMDASTLAASDIVVSSGEVQNLRPALLHDATFGGPGSGGGEFRNPTGVAANASGHVYVADKINSRVQVFNRTGAYAADLPGPFSFPSGVAVDGSSGAVYVAMFNDKVRVFDSSGAYAADLPGPFHRPTGVAVDGSTGAVYVTDGNNGRVHAFNSTLHRVAGIDGQFNGPKGVAAGGPAGYVYVADTGNDIVQIFDHAGNTAGNITGLLTPHGVAVDGHSGAVYVADTSNNRVRAFDSSLARAADLPGSFDKPQGVAVGGPAGYVYVADSGNNQVQVFRPAYAFDVYDPADGQNLTVSLPAGRAEDAAGNENEASNAASIMIDRTGPVANVTAAQDSLTSATTINFTVNFSKPVEEFESGDIVVSGTADRGGIDNFSGADATWTFDVSPLSDGTVVVDIPAGVARDEAGNGNVAAARLVIVHHGTPPVPNITPALSGPASPDPAPFLVEFGEKMDASSLNASDFVVSSGEVRNLRPALLHDATFGGRGNASGQFEYPSDVAVDGHSGRVYVADTFNDRVQVFDSAGDYASNITGSLRNPSGVAVDASSGRVYVADTGKHRVLVFDPAGEHAGTIAGPPGDAFNNPSGVAVNGSGHVYVADTYKSRIQIFDPAGDYASNITGSFTHPSDVAVGGPAGSTYVPDKGKHRVLVFDPAGDYDYSITGLYAPSGVAVDGATGSVYVADTGNLRVQVFDSDGNHAGTVAGPFDNPTRVAVGGPSGFAYVADRNGHSIHAFRPAYAFDVYNPADGQTLTVSLPAGRATDAGGDPNNASNTASIHIDSTAPTVDVTAAQVSPTNATTIGFTVNFSEPVLGFAAANVTLSGNATHGGAANFAAANATTWTFDVSPESDGTIRVDIPAGAARDKAGNGNEAEQFSIEYDGTAPTANVTAAQPDPTNAATIGFTVNFSEPVEEFESGDIVVSGTAARGGIADFSGADATWTFDVSPTSDGTVVVDIPAGITRDEAGNGNEAAARLAITRHGTHPVPNITLAESGLPSPDAVPFLVEFGERMDASSLDASDFVVSSGTVQNLRPALLHDATFGGNGAGDGRFKQPTGVAVDGSSGRVYVVDKLNHRVQVFDSARDYAAELGPFSRPSGVAVDGSSGAVYVTDTFNHKTRVFDSSGAQAADLPGQFDQPFGVAVDGSTGAVYVTDKNNTRVHAFNSTLHRVAGIDGQFNGPKGVAAGGPAGYVYVADAGNYTVQIFDHAGNPAGNITGLTSPHGVAVDGHSGAVYVANTYNDSVRAFNSSLARAADLPGKFLRPEGVAAGGPAGYVYVADSQNNQVQAFRPAYAFDVHDPADGQDLTVSMAAGRARDAGGDTNAASNAASIYVTRTGPTVIVTAAQDSPTNAATISFTVNFSRPVPGFTAGDVVLSGIASSSDVVNFRTANDMTYEFDVSPESDGTILVDVPAGAARDEAGNGNHAAERFSIEYDGTAPTARVTAAQDSPTSAPTIGFTVNFSEPVLGFEPGDVKLSGTAPGIVENFAAAGDTAYAFGVSPESDGTILVDVPAGAARDRAGNGNEAAERFSIEYDGTAPTVNVTAAQDSPTSAPTIGFTVNFSEPVLGFEPGDVKLSGTAPGIVENFAAAGDTAYAFGVSPESPGIILVDVPAGAARDRAGNGNEAAERFSIEYGAAAPGTGLAVLSAAITGPQQATVRYNADADAAGSAYGPIEVGGANRTAELSGSGTDAHVLRFGGDAAARDATGAVTINPAAVTGPAGGSLGGGGAYRQPLADGQAPLLASAALDLTAGSNGLLTVTFDEAAAAAPDVRSLGGDITMRGAGGAAALSGGDIPSVASGRAGDNAFALGVSGAKRVQLNGDDLGSAPIMLPEAFVYDAAGNPHAGEGGQPPVLLEYSPDPTPPVLAAATFNLAPAGGGAGRLTVTFDEAVTVPDVQSFEGTVEIRGRGGGGNSTLALSAGDAMSVESGRTGDRTFALLVPGQARAALGAAEFADPASTTVSLPSGFVSNGRAGYERERAPLEVARDAAGPSFLWAFVLNGSSVAVVYDEPVLTVPAHYGNITVGGVAAGGSGGGASGAAAFGSTVVVSWNANASTAASAGSAVGFDLSASVTDAFGNPLANPGPKSTGGEGGTRLDGKPHARAGVFSAGPGDPSAGAARLGAAAFNALSAGRGYAFYVSVSEHELPAGAAPAAAEAALRGAHMGGEGPSLYVGPASDMALGGMAGYASENGITIISHSSAARSLAVEGDAIFRMEPGAAHLARALALVVARGGYGAVVPVVQAGLHGPDYGLLEPLASDLSPLGIPVGPPVSFPGGGGGAAAAPIGAAVLEAAGNGTARSVAVVYMGSDVELAAMAGSVPADGPIRERSAWFAAGGAGAGAGSGVAASPAVLADAAAVQLARDVRLSAVQFAAERNAITDYIDRIAAPRGPAASATPAYAAYEAVRVLGGALALAGGDPSLAGGNIAGAAALEGGPLGRTGMDGSGDLRLPVTYGAWSVSDAAAEWVRAPELLLGLTGCGIELEKSALALPPLTAGSTSRPARQTITNTGTVPLPAVSVSATDWTQFLGGVPIPDAHLPFSYTEMAVGLDGAPPRRADSAPLAADTAIPGGTPPGGSVDVDFRINLEELDVLRADLISQTVTFVVNC